MDSKNERRSVIKFWCLLKKSAARTVKLMHEAYIDEEKLGDLTILQWHKAFFKSREIAALLPRVRRPLSICTEMVNTDTAVIWENHHITVRQLTVALDISKSSVYMILLAKLKMWRVTNSSLPGSRTERPLCWDFSRVANVNIRIKWRKYCKWKYILSGKWKKTANKLENIIILIQIGQ